tara:strand:+ start:5081 stop:5524 length:444 start_codon:yes stop_codon:yes gene_type:complete
VRGLVPLILTRGKETKINKEMIHTNSNPVVENVEHDYDVPEIRNQQGSAFMKGLEKYLRFSESKDVKAQAYEERRARTLQEKKEIAGVHGTRGIEGLGQLTGTIPAREFFRWQQELGNECWNDKHFSDSFFRDNPEYKVDNYVSGHI